MPWRLLYHPRVRSRDLPPIPADQKRRIERAIRERLSAAPDRYGERLRKDLSGAWKLRVGDYRVVFDLDLKRNQVYIFVVAHRRKVCPIVKTRRRR